VTFSSARRFGLVLAGERLVPAEHLHQQSADDRPTEVVLDDDGPGPLGDLSDPAMSSMLHAAAMASGSDGSGIR